MLFHTVTGSHPRRQLLCIGKRNTPHKTRTSLFHDSLSPRACPAQETQQDTTKVKEFVVVRFTGICGLRRLLILLIFGQGVVISTSDQSSGVESGSPCLCILETQYI